MLERRMPEFKDREISYDRIDELVRQLEFDKQVALIKAMLSAKAYQEYFDQDSEELSKNYQIPFLQEDELDLFLLNEMKNLEEL
jgi:hypothetical protein